MTIYNVSITSAVAEQTVEGAQVSADTVEAALKEANAQAAVLAHQDHQGAWDWKATVTAV
jgi:hypothetical protein